MILWIRTRWIPKNCDFSINSEIFQWKLKIFLSWSVSKAKKIGKDLSFMKPLFKTQQLPLFQRKISCLYRFLPVFPLLKLANSGNFLWKSGKTGKDTIFKNGICVAMPLFSLTQFIFSWKNILSWNEKNNKKSMKEWKRFSSPTSSISNLQVWFIWTIFLQISKHLQFFLEHSS